LQSLTFAAAGGLAA
jgi:hypothetical protein